MKAGIFIIDLHNDFQRCAAEVYNGRHVIFSLSPYRNPFHREAFIHTGISKAAWRVQGKVGHITHWLFMRDDFYKHHGKFVIDEYPRKQGAYPNIFPALSNSRKPERLAEIINQHWQGVHHHLLPSRREAEEKILGRFPHAYNISLPYPLLRSRIDYFLVPVQALKRFCFYINAFNPFSKMYPEVIVPTCYALAVNDFVNASPITFID